jgi:hypothetical protein
MRYNHSTVAMIVIKKLVWDEWNTAHIARHDVIPAEVEQACHNNPLVQEGKKGRVAVTGKTGAGRMITTILDPEPEHGVYYPVTAYTTSRKYRRIYEKEKGSEDAA